MKDLKSSIPKKKDSIKIKNGAYYINGQFLGFLACRHVSKTQRRKHERYS